MKSILFLIFFVSLHYQVIANPVDLNVIEGIAHARPNTALGDLVLDVSDRAILQWSDFSIGCGEKVQFVLPGSDAAVLNRVVGSHKSLIDGRLESNGHVLLINPHGILIGPKGQVDVGSLIASSLDLQNSQFLDTNEWAFVDGGSGGIVNCGTIRSSYGGVSLLGRYVHNEGRIEGSTLLASQQQVFLKLEKNKQILIRVTEPPQTVHAAISQGKNPYEYAIKNSGTIDALSLCCEDGRVILKASDEVQITGKIYGNSDVSGKIVQVEGEIKAPSGELNLISSKLTEVNKNALIDLKGQGEKDGGRALIYSDQSVLFAGIADIGGGPLGGNGGTIDLSGLQSLEYTGTVHRSAPNGDPGTLIFDPDAKLTISQTPNYHHHFDGKTHTPLKQMVNINIKTLLNELEKGPVTILTQYNGYDHELAGIEIAADIAHTYDSPYPLTLHSSSPSGIEVIGSLVNQGKGPIKLESTRGNIHHKGMLETSGPLSFESEEKIFFEGTRNQKATAIGRNDGTLELKSAKGIYTSHSQLVSHNGDLILATAGPIALNEGTEIINSGKGAITFSGLKGTPIESIYLDRAKIHASIHAGPMTVAPVSQDVQIDSTAIRGGIGGIHFQHIGGSFILRGTHSPALILSEGTLDMHAKGDILIDGDQKGAMLNAHRMIRINTDHNFIQSANGGEARTSSLESIAIGADHILLSGQKTRKASIEGEGLSLSADQSLQLFSQCEINGGNRALLVNTGGEVSLSNPLDESPPLIIAGHIHLQSNATISLENDAKILSTQGSLNLQGKQGVHLSDLAEVNAFGENLSIRAPEGNIQMYQNTSLLGKVGEIRLSAGKSVILEHFSKIMSEGNKGVIIIVDTMGSSARGGLIMGQNTSITTDQQAPLRIFSTARHLNSIEGSLNGFKYVNAPLFFSTQEEQWGVSSHTTNSTGPFTIFHRNHGLILGQYAQKEFKQILTNFIGPFNAELFRNLHPFNEYTLKQIQFVNKFSSKPGDFKPDALSSFEIIKDTGYSIRKRTLPNNQYWNQR